MIIATPGVYAQNITVSLAGDSTAAYSGNGGFCTLSQISGPTDVCMQPITPTLQTMATV